MQDSYGSEMRERMKRSMERPVQYRRLNAREPQMAKPLTLLLFAIGIMVLGVVGLYTLDKVEGRFRTPAVQR